MKIGKNKKKLAAKMNGNNLNNVREELIVRQQWVALIVTFILFGVTSAFSIKVLGVGKYGILGIIPMFAIGVSSIKYRVSILRVRGQKGYSKGTRAIIFGILIIVNTTVWIVIVLTPPLADVILPF